MKNEEHGSSRVLSHTVCSPLDVAIKGLKDIAFLAPNVTHGWAVTTRAIAFRALDDLAALVAEEQVAGDSSREANETDWKARCEAAEQALEGMREALSALIVHYEMGDYHNEGAFDETCSDCRALQSARAALNPTPQGGKP